MGVGRSADEVFVAQSLFEGLEDSRAACGGGVMRDALLASALSTEALFHFTRVGLHAAFAISRRVVGCERSATQWLGLGPVSAALGYVDDGLAKSYELSNRYLRKVEENVISGLSKLDLILEDKQYNRGDLVRLLFKNDQHTRDALLNILHLLQKLSLDMPKERCPVKFITGATRLAEAQRAFQERQTEQLLDKNRLSFVAMHDAKTHRHWQQMMRHSLAAYGPVALRVMQLVSSKSDTFSKAVCELTGVNEQDVLLVSSGGEMYYPAHYVAIDHQQECVTVVLRGSMCASDVLVDLVCEHVKFELPVEEQAGGETLLEGKAHRGFLIAARRLAEELEPEVLKAVRGNPMYRVTVTGHSLGAGVATVLALLWAKDCSFSGIQVQSIAFGAPCTLGHELSQLPFTRKVVTSFVLGDDFVSRLSFGTVSELQRRIHALSEVDSEPQEFLLEQDAHEHKLFSAGSVWLLGAEEFNGNAVEIDPMHLLTSLQVSAKTLTLHFPLRYLEAIDGLPVVTCA